MCTLTYIPNHQNGFIFTSNRDEATARKSALIPKEYSHQGIKVFYPKDEEAGGTWVATALNGFTLCLLNGAFEKHIRKQKYVKSRGLVLLDFFEYNSVSSFTSEYVFDGIEPFTLVIVKHSNDSTQIFELRWDELKLHVSEMNSSQAHIWSSVTLYDPTVIAARNLWFKQFLIKNPAPNLEDLFYFHKFGGDGNIENSILMNRANRVRTLSITSIENKAGISKIVYEDLAKNSKYILPVTN